MRRRPHAMTRLLTCSIALRAALLCSLLCLPAHADSIRVGETVYTDVLVRASSSLYYIQHLATGEIQTVHKNRVDPASVHLSKPAERKKLNEAWRAKRVAVGKPLPPVAPTPPIGPSVAEVTAPPPPPVPQLTNVPEKLAKRRQGRTLFVSGEGVGVLTNQPGKFRDDRDYVELVIHYDPIVVPVKFRSENQSTGLRRPNRLPDIVTFYADFYDLDSNLLYAMIKVESNGDPYAVSRAGARGLMQLMPGTASDMGVHNVFDPAQNVAGGTQYIAKMFELFQGDETFALAAYNAGPGRVKRYGGIPPFKETQNYVREVLRLQKQYQRYGPPHFDASPHRKVAFDYLPPESINYYRIKLFNGLTLPAEGIRSEGDRYLYVFEGRSGSIPKDRVRIIYEPAAGD